MKTIGIDIGTTSISGVILDLNNGKIIYKETVESNSFINTSYEWERIQAVDVVIEKAKQLLDRCLEQCSDIQAIGLTGQMHGIVYTNALGQAISPLYTWQDQRGQLAINDGQSIVDEINQYTKHPVATGYGLVTHAYHVRKQCVPRNAKNICTIMDYFGMFLTKRTYPLMHISNAASLGFWNTEKGNFEEDVLEKFDIDLKILPETTRDVVPLGTYHDIPVLVALGDNQASFLGTVGNQSSAVLVNMGTGGQVSLLVDHYVQIKDIETRPFIEGKYLLVGASLCGGRAYAILENFLRRYVKEATGIEQSQYAVMENLANRVMDQENSLSVETTLKGTRSNPQQLGSIQNISEDNFHPEHLIYGFMQGMIEELYQMYLGMKEAVKGEVHMLMASGNGIRKNQALRKICEKKFSLPLVLAKYEEEAACGAAISYQYSSSL